MKGPLTKPTVKLIGHDGNAFSIMGRVKKALMLAGADQEFLNSYPQFLQTFALVE